MQHNLIPHVPIISRQGLLSLAPFLPYRLPYTLTHGDKDTDTRLHRVLELLCYTSLRTYIRM